MIIGSINRLNDAIKRKGLTTVIIRSIQCLLALPISIIIILISPLIKIRLISLYTSRIGEYALNNYFMMCALECDDYPQERNCIHFFYVYSDTPICNIFFHKMWSRVILVLPFGVLWSFVDRIIIRVLGEKYNTPFKKIYQGSGGDSNRWNYFSKKRQFLSFTEKEKLKGEALKRQLGIPADKPFVCLLVRDSRYLQIHMPQSEDWKYHEYRNANIENYFPAIEFLTKNGFYVVRMGKHVDCQLSFDNKKCIDYASNTLRSDFMDVYLSATCAFFFSSNCGIDAIAQIFDRPILTTNSILFDMDSYLNWTLTTPKNIFCKKTNSIVEYRKIYQEYKNFFLSGKYLPPQDPRSLMFIEWGKKGWVLAENTPDEILLVVKEMIDFLSNCYLKTEEIKKMQHLFWENFPLQFSLKKVVTDNVNMFISPYFIEKHKKLLMKSPMIEICEVN
ncbi:MAG: TIGR04372 family glycosyltransferase [Gammaproteobacteria bacterium]|nr:TIGR04372 family glycosyltransferase [Gammaproteobacteria bacterium]